MKNKSEAGYNSQMKIPVDVLRAAWIAGTLERRRLEKTDPRLGLQKTPEELWNEAGEEYASAMAACARVIEDFVTSCGNGGKKKE